MEEADNIVIRSDNIASKTRGNYLYFNPSSSVLNNLFNYNNTLLAAFTNKLSTFADTGSAPNETGTESILTGATVAIASPRVSRDAQANKNFYFTTDNGVLKIESTTSTIYTAGIPPGLDLALTYKMTATGGIVNGPIVAGNQVGYRVVFGRRDSNDNLLLGAPSDISTINNDYEDSTYTSVTVTITVTSVAHGLTTGMSVTFVDGTDTAINGTYSVTRLTANTFSYVVPVAPTTATGAISWATTRTVRLEFSVPSELSDTANGYFYQVYRTSQVSVTESLASDFKLVAEFTLSAGQLSSHVAFFDDIVADILLASSAQLYTNPNSREGELQANFRPPKCEDILTFKNHVFYLNVVTRHLLNLQLTSLNDGANPPNPIIVNNSYIEIYSGDAIAATYTATGAGPYTVTVTKTSHGLATGYIIYVSEASDADALGEYAITSTGANTFTYSATGNPSASGTIGYKLVRKYVAKTGVANFTVQAETVTNSGGEILITYTAHGFSNGWTVYIANVVGGTLAAGTYYVVSAAANSFKISLTSGGVAVAYAGETQLDFEGITDGLNPIFYFDNSSSSVSVQLRDTASSIVKAVNRDSLSLIYGRYTSGLTDTPGMIQLLAKGFGGAIYVRASSTAVGAEFNPVLPSSFSTGTQVYSRNDSQPNTFYSSKVGEPEAVPIVNFFPTGARNKAILRGIALRDSVILVKEDGVYRVTGDGVTNFTVTALDTTVVCVAKSSVKILNNQVVFLSNQGVCLSTESAVRIVSRRIDDVIQPILGKATLEAQTGAVAYESDRFYFLTTVTPNGTTAAVTYIYNILNDTWTTGNNGLLKQGVIGPKDTMFFINTSGLLQRERKSQNKIDYSGQNYSITVNSVASNSLSASITSVSVVPTAGDMIVKNSVISHIADVTPLGVNAYTVTFSRATNLAALDTQTLYVRIVSRIKMAPFHAGILGRFKQFCQMQLHIREPSISRLFISFQGYVYGGSEITDWKLSNVTGTTQGGWGFEPWGFFPWGQEDGINIIAGTQSDPPIRIYIPRFQQRSTFIQPVLEHREAGEAINLQAMDFAMRAYQERISK